MLAQKMDPKTEAETVFNNPELNHLPDHVKNYIYLRDYAPVANSQNEQNNEEAS